MGNILADTIADRRRRLPGAIPRHFRQERDKYPQEQSWSRSLFKLFSKQVGFFQKDRTAANRRFRPQAPITHRRDRLDYAIFKSVVRLVILTSNIVKFLIMTSDQQKRNIYNSALAPIGWRSYRPMLTRSLLMLAIVVSLGTASALAVEGRVELELVTEQGFPLTGAHDWMKTFSKLGIDGIRIRGARSGDMIEVETRGTESRPVYHVKGLLTGRNKVRLPGGATFSQHQSKQIGAWLDRLARLGPDGKEEEKTVFGLTTTQFEQLTASLSRGVTFDTKDVAVGQVVAQFQQRLNQRVVIAKSAQQTLTGNQAVLDDLQGVSYGTALAASLRPAGLVFLSSHVGRVDRIGYHQKQRRQRALADWLEVQEALGPCGPGVGQASEC